MESQAHNGSNTTALFADKNLGLSNNSQRQESDRVKSKKLVSPVLHLNAPVENMKLDDHDETSSGYSSPESHCWPAEPVQSRKPQASPMTPVSNGQTAKNNLMDTVLENKSLNSLLIKQEKDETIQKTGPLKTNSPKSMQQRVLLRQAEIDHTDTDCNFKSNEKLPKEVRTDDDIIKENLIDKQVQTEPYEHDADLIQSLQKSNGDLRQRLELRNTRLENVVEELENQLLSAMKEIAQLRSHLLVVNKLKKQSLPCTKCGYHSESEINRTETTPISRPRSGHNLRKASSVDSLIEKSTSSSNNSAVKVILKGQDPNKMKLALLERNKTLRDEIENLKSVKLSSRSSSASSLISPKLPTSASSSRSSVTEYDKYDLAMDQIITKETEVLSRRKTNQRPVHEHVRWKQNPRSSKKPTKNNALHSQSTSRAFRTIDVKTWAATTT